MGRRPRPRGPVIDAVLVVDKTRGPSSHDVVAQLRRILGHSRVGHTGTLDPMATGVLICCVGRATRLVPYLQGGEKTYVATATLGVSTDSYDAMGAVTATIDAAHIDQASVAAALQPFHGEIEQIPPMVSAVKIGGERLYVKARRGEEVERPARKVTITALTLDDFTPGSKPTVTFTVTCTAGTYIRSIAHDLGQGLHVGAHLTDLRRTVNGGFSLAEAVPVEQLEATSWQTHAVDLISAVARHMPVVHLTDIATVRGLTHGRSLDATGAGPVAVTTVLPSGATQLVGIYDGQGQGDTLQPACVLLGPEELT